jgi:hypothetical protein
MDIAIRQIDRGALKDAVSFKLCPLRSGQDFECGGGLRRVFHAPSMSKSEGQGKRV